MYIYKGSFKLMMGSKVSVIIINQENSGKRPPTPAIDTMQPFTTRNVLRKEKKQQYLVVLERPII